MFPNKKLWPRLPSATYKDVAPILMQAELDALCLKDEMDVACEVKHRVARPSGKECTIDAPCWRWGCTTGCEEAYREAPFFEQEAHEYLDSGDGRIDLWCAEQARKAGMPEQRKNRDSKEPPSFG